MGVPARGIVLIDGESFQPEAAKISVFDRGFLYGDSVFETLRTYGSEPFALDRHLARLERSARLANIQLPVAPAELAVEIRRAIELAGFPESYVRVTLTRGIGEKLGLDPEFSSKPGRVLIVLPLEPLPAAKYEQGIAAITYRTQRIADGTEAAGAKLGNYLLSVLAIRAARAQNAEEALLVDAEGRVLEGTTCNVFAYREERLVTAPESLGILAGITRAEVLHVARELGVVVEERALLVSELYDCSEVFISSSIRELVPVVTIDGRPIANRAPGPLTRALHAAFRRRVGAVHSGAALLC